MTLTCLHSSSYKNHSHTHARISFSIPCPRDSNCTFDNGLLSRTYQGIPKELAPPKVNEPETEHPASRIRCHLNGRAEEGEFSQRTTLKENVAWRDGVV